MISNSSKAIIFLCVLLLLLETVLFVKFHKFSQHGLDDRLCKCTKPSEYPPAFEGRVLNGVAANRNDFKWAASVFTHKRMGGSMPGKFRFMERWNDSRKLPMGPIVWVTNLAKFVDVWQNFSKNCLHFLLAYPDPKTSSNISAQPRVSSSFDLNQKIGLSRFVAN